LGHVHISVQGNEPVVVLQGKSNRQISKKSEAIFPLTCDAVLHRQKLFIARKGDPN